MYNYARDLDPGVRDRFPVFAKDALNICDKLHEQGKKVSLSLDTTRSDFAAAIKDETISDIVVIGNGTLGRVFIPAPDKRIGWGHVGRMTEHLKTGRFIQRLCGGTPDALNVPLGILAARSHSSVLAPIQKYFTPNSADHRHNKLIVPVTDKERMSLADIKESFPRMRKHYTPEQKSAYTLNALQRLIVLSARTI